MSGAGQTPEAVRAAVERVAAREELRSLYDDHQGLLERFLNWLSGLGDSPRDASSLGDSATSSVMNFLPVLLWILVISLVVIGIVVLVVRTWPRSGKDAGDGLDAERRAELIAEQLARARAARAAGDLGLALRLFWGALVTGLGRTDELAFRSAWTCREMLRRTRRRGPAVELLDELLPRVERLEFGREVITTADVEQLERLCDERLVRVLAKEQER